MPLPDGSFGTAFTLQELQHVADTQPMDAYHRDLLHWAAHELTRAWTALAERKAHDAARAE